MVCLLVFVKSRVESCRGPQKNLPLKEFGAQASKKVSPSMAKNEREGVHVRLVVFSHHLVLGFVGPLVRLDKLHIR